MNGSAVAPSLLIAAIVAGCFCVVFGHNPASSLALLTFLWIAVQLAMSLALVSHIYEFWASSAISLPTSNGQFDGRCPPKVSIHVPVHNEPVDVVTATLRSLATIKYPNFEIIIIDNNTPNPDLWLPIQELCRELNFRFYHLKPWPGFKAGALNFALSVTAPDAKYISVIDSDYLVDPDFLDKCLPYFASAKIAYVQPPQEYRFDSESFYQRSLHAAYRQFFDVSMTSRNLRGTTIPVGTMSIIDRHVLVSVSGWNERSITEDAELGMRLATHGYSGLYLPWTKGRGLMPFLFRDLRKQRFRWAYGGIQIFCDYWRDIIKNTPKGTDQRATSLTFTQRIGYFILALHWLESLLGLLNTSVLIAVTVTAFFSPKLSPEWLVGSAAIYSLFLILANFFSFVLAAMRRSGCSFAVGCGAFGILLSLVWPVALANIKAFLRMGSTFERTPKYRSGTGSLAETVWMLRVELLLALACLCSAVLSAWMTDGDVAFLLSLNCLAHMFGYLLPIGAVALERRRRTVGSESG
jgi:cellulose synthase/poly-beta-1,6-N-acetylglucosamine synthase-like glycosyltransferase